MENPFSSLEARLENIEKIMLNVAEQINATAHIQESENVMTLQDVAKDIFKEEVKTTRARIRRGEFIGHRKGKRLYFLKSEMMDYIKSDPEKPKIRYKAVTK